MLCQACARSPAPPDWLPPTDRTGSARRGRGRPRSLCSRIRFGHRRRRARLTTNPAPPVAAARAASGSPPDRGQPVLPAGAGLTRRGRWPWRCDSLRRSRTCPASLGRGGVDPRNHRATAAVGALDGTRTERGSTDTSIARPSHQALNPKTRLRKDSMLSVIMAPATNRNRSRVLVCLETTVTSLQSCRWNIFQYLTSLSAPEFTSAI